MLSTLFWVQGPGSALGAEPPSLILRPGLTHASIVARSMYAKDPNHAWNLADARRAGSSGSFQSAGPRTAYNFGVRSATYWVRFRIQPAGPHVPSDKLIISTDSAVMDSISIYCPLKNGTYMVLRDDPLAPGGGPAGYGDAFKRPAFRVPADFDPRGWFIARLRFGTAGAAFTLRLSRESAFNRLSRRVNVVAGILLGAALAMALYNLFLFFAMGDKLYLAYVAQVLFAALHQVLSTGLYRTVWPGFWNMFPSGFEPTAVLFAAPPMIAGCIFASLFLESKKRLPVYHWIFRGAVAMGLISLALGFAGERIWIGRLAYFMGGLLPLILLAAGVSALRKGYRPALYFLTAWSVLMGGVLIFVLRGLGMLPHNGWTFNAIAFTGVAETLLLSFALGARIRVLRAERAELRAREEELARMTVTDDLTGLFTRGYLHRALPEQIQRARERKRDLSLIFLDVDHFKQYNDTRGHPAGDVVLRALAETVHACIRESDIACRYGGEEFVVILPGADLEVGARVADRIHRTFAQADFQGDAATTVSIGVARRREGEDGDTLLDRADRAMYRAKELGRNRTEVSRDEN